MMNRFHILTLFALMSIVGWSQTAFQKGIDAANKKDFNSAIKWFEEVAEKEPNNVSALVNLGNSYFENKYFGKAILNYEKALKITPNDSEISQNIEACYLALNKQEVYVSPYGKIELLLYRIGELTWGLLSILFSIFAAYSLFKFIRKKGTQRMSNAVGFIGSLLLSILFLLFTREVHNFKSTKDQAIITVQNATVCENEMGELSSVTLTEGTRIQVLKETKEFYQFKDKSGKVLYLRRSNAERF